VGDAAVEILANVINFSAGIRAFEKWAQWEPALNLFRVMPQLRLAQTRFSFDVSISACEKAAPWEFHVAVKTLAQRVSFKDGFSACKTCQALSQSSCYADLSLDVKQLTRTAHTSRRLHHNPKFGYDHLAKAAQLAAESSSRTNVNVCTIDDITKSSILV
jgi:hypothetical protein